MISEQENYQKIVLNLCLNERLIVKPRKSRPMPWWFHLVTAKRTHEARVRQLTETGQIPHPHWAAWGRRLG